MGDYFILIMRITFCVALNYTNFLANSSFLVFYKMNYRTMCRYIADQQSLNDRSDFCYRLNCSFSIMHVHFTKSSKTTQKVIDCKVIYKTVIALRNYLCTLALLTSCI